MIGDFLASLPPSLTPAAPYFSFYIIWVVLGWTALIDAMTGRVSRPLIWLGGIVAVFASQQAEGWYIAGVRLTVAMAVFVLLRLVNEAYYRLWRRDPYGYGDMRWSGLAAYAFGVTPVFWAWIFGAWLGVLFMGLTWLLAVLLDKPRPRGYLHFAPFLLLGLVAALYARPYWHLIF